MDSVVRVLAVYAFLLIAFRLVGKRTLAEATAFDFLVLLVLSETLQQALVGDDRSITNAVLMVTTFVLIAVTLSLLKQRSQGLEKLLEDVPTILVKNGRPIEPRMREHRVDVQDVLESARITKGISTLGRIRYAILERTGEISIIGRDD